jgi:hypothetical protein
MWNGKYVEFDMIMERVLSNPIFVDVSYSDALEWTYQAMAKIGTTIPYIHKVTDGNKDMDHIDPIEIVNYKAEIPCDLYMLEQIRDWDTQIPYIYSSYIYHESTNRGNVTGTAVTTCDSCSLNGTCTLTADLYPSPLNNYNCYQYQALYPVTNTVATNANSIAGELTYTMNDNYIITSRESGFLELAYWAFPTSCDLKPLIPDYERYIEAITKYIQYKEAEKLWIIEKLSGEKFKYFEQEWYFYVNSAFVGMNTPNYSKAELIMRNSTRQVQTPNAVMNSFMQLNPLQRYTAFFRNRRFR